MMIDSGMKADILAEMISLGFNPSAGAHADKFIEAIAKGVVTHIKNNAKANVTSGSSTGLWSIQ